MIYAKSFTLLMKSYVKPKLDSSRKQGESGSLGHLNTRKFQEDRLRK